MTDSKNGGSRRDASQLFAILDDLAGITELQKQPINEVELDYCDPVPLPRALIDRTLESIRSMQVPEVAALDASQLYPILDDLAGITELQRQPINEVELDYCDPVPLPPALIDRTLESIRSMQAPEVAETADLGSLDESELDRAEPVPFSQESTDRSMRQLRVLREVAQATPERRWWQRTAVLLPICLLLIAAVPAYYYVWGRKDDTKLVYEDALNIVFDSHYTEESRNVALTRIAFLIKRGISQIADRAVQDENLRGAAVFGLGELEDMVDSPSSVSLGQIYPPGHMDHLIGTFEWSGEGALQEHQRALPEFVQACRSGIYVLFKAQEQGGLLLHDSRLQFMQIKRELQRLK